MCACDETGTCPRCRADDRRWLEIERGDDPDLEARIERLQGRVEYSGVMRDPKEGLK